MSLGGPIRMFFGVHCSTLLLFVSWLIVLAKLDCGWGRYIPVPSSYWCGEIISLNLAAHVNDLFLSSLPQCCSFLFFPTHPMCCAWGRFSYCLQDFINVSSLKKVFANVARYVSENAHLLKMSLDMFLASSLPWVFFFLVYKQDKSMTCSVNISYLWLSLMLSRKSLTLYLISGCLHLHKSFGHEILWSGLR